MAGILKNLGEQRTGQDMPDRKNKATGIPARSPPSNVRSRLNFIDYSGMSYW